MMDKKETPKNEVSNSEKQVPLIERWAQDKNPCGFTDPKNTKSKETKKIIINGIKYLPLEDVSKMIGRTPRTIKNWYERYRLQDEAEKAKLPLPEVFIGLVAKKTRLFLESEIHMFEVFRDNKSYGTMPEVNRTNLSGKSRTTGRRSD